jgi:hypothetical protein
MVTIVGRLPPSSFAEVCVLRLRACVLLGLSSANRGCVGNYRRKQVACKSYPLLGFVDVGSLGQGDVLIPLEEGY